MRVLKVLDELKLYLVDLEVALKGKKQNAPTLRTKDENQVIPLNTPDGRPILMNWDNAIEL